MKIIKNVIFFYLSLILFFGVAIKGMLSRKVLSESAQRVRDKALALSKERRAQRQIYQAKSIVPHSYTFKPKPMYILPRMRYDQFSEKELVQIRSELKDNEFFVYQQASANGIKVSKEIAMLSKTLRNLIDDADSSITKELIPMHHDFGVFSLTAMDFVFNVLFKNILDESVRLNKPIHEIRVVKPIYHSFQELIDINNLLNYLDPVSEHIQKTYLYALREHIAKNSIKLVDNPMLDELHPDLQKRLVLEYAHNFLNGLMIRDNIAHNEERYVWDSAWSDQSKILSTAFSPDGMQVAVGGSRNNKGSDTFALFDLQSKKKLPKEAMTSIYSVDYNNTGTQVIIGTEGARGSNLISFDLKEKKNHFFGNIHDGVAKALFSPDNTKILALVKEFLGPTKLNIFDAITGQLLHTFGEGYMNKITFSSDGKMILSASQKKLHLWTDTGELIKKVHSFKQGFVGSIAFNSEGTKILVTHNTVTVWNAPQFLSIFDISNQSTIPEPKTFSFKSTLGENDSYEFVLIDDASMLIWKDEKIFFVSFDDNEITNEILVQPSNYSVLKVILSSLSLSRDKNKIAGGGYYNIESFTNYLHVWTIMKPEDRIILKNLAHADVNQLRLIYQLWLAFRQGVNPSAYDLNEVERVIYQTLPRRIQQLLQVTLF